MKWLLGSKAWAKCKLRMDKYVITHPEKTGPLNTQGHVDGEFISRDHQQFYNGVFDYMLENV
jgi:hypothetical protein